MENFFSVFRTANDILFKELPKENIYLQCLAVIPTIPEGNFHLSFTDNFLLLCEVKNLFILARESRKCEILCEMDF